MATNQRGRLLSPHAAKNSADGVISENKDISEGAAKQIVIGLVKGNIVGAEQPQNRRIEQNHENRQPDAHKGEKR